MWTLRGQLFALLRLLFDLHDLSCALPATSDIVSDASRKRMSSRGCILHASSVPAFLRLPSMYSIRYFSSLFVKLLRKYMRFTILGIIAASKEFPSLQLLSENNPERLLGGLLSDGLVSPDVLCFPQLDKLFASSWLNKDVLNSLMLLWITSFLFYDSCML